MTDLKWFENMSKALGGKLYLVGGTVRDSLMNNKEPKDYDLATPLTADEVIKAIGGRYVDAASALPIVLVKNDEGEEVEIASFRTEDASSRHEVEWKYAKTMEEDAARRDFTVNALYMDAHGVLYDPTGRGVGDVKNRVLRFVGNPYDRIREDEVRLLRAIRFAGRGFKMTTETFLAAAKAGVVNLPAERIAMELQKMLEENPTACMELMFHSGIMESVLPEVHNLGWTYHWNEYHLEGTVFTHTRLCLQYCQDTYPDDWVLILAVLLHDIGKAIPGVGHQLYCEKKGRSTFHGHDIVGAEMVEVVCDRLKLPNSVKDTVVWLVKNHIRVRKINDMKASKRKAMVLHPDWDRLVKLSDCDDHGSMPFRSYVEVLRAIKIEEQPPSIKDVGIDGRFLIDNFGMFAGPMIGKAIRTMQEAFDEDPTLTKDELLCLIFTPGEGLKS